MTPDELRESVLDVVTWFEEAYRDIGCRATDVEAFAVRVRGEVDRDLGGVEPRCAVLSLIDRPRRYRVLKSREAPAVVLAEARENLRRVPEQILAASGDALFEPRSQVQHTVGELVFRYRSYWDGCESGGISEETSLESGWTSIDFADHFIEVLARPAWNDLWKQQHALLASHACPDFPLTAELEGQNLAPKGLATLKKRLEGRGSWDGMLETPFFVGRLAALLGPPPEAWGGGSYALVGQLDGKGFNVVATESQGHGFRHMVGAVGQLDGLRMRAAMDDFVEVLLESPQVGDVETLCFHFDSVFAFGARQGRLFYEPLCSLPFWIDAYPRFGA